MIDTPDFWWLTALLALVLFVDAVMSIRPPVFVQECLDGVRFPRDWWWVLIVVKLLAAAGLVAGLEYPGVGVATNVAVIAYFLCASYAHIRARFLGSVFWLNCLGLLSLSIVTLVLGYVI